MKLTSQDMLRLFEEHLCIFLKLQN